MKKLKLIEYNSMIWFLLRAAIVGIILSTVISLSKQDAWISGLLAIVFGIIPVYLFIKLKKIDSKANIIKLNMEHLGLFGKFLNFLMMLTVLGFIFIIFWNLVNFISTEFLYKTPPLYVAIWFMLPIVYAGFKDFNTVSKISLISLYFVILTIILILVGLSKEIDISNLMPIFNNEIPNILKSTFLIFVYNVLPIFVLLIIPEDMIEKDSSKTTVIFYFLALLSFVNILVIVLSGFSVDLASIYDFAEFHIFKRFALGNFLDKIESFLSIEWVLGMIISIIVCTHYLKKSFMQMTNTNKKLGNIMVALICFLLVLAVTYLFRTPNEMRNYVVNIFSYVMFIGLFLVPFISYTFIKIKKRSHKSLINQNANTG